MISLNYFPFNSTKLKKFFYILIWSIFLTVFELGAVHIGKVLHYGKWKIWYSAILYPFLLFILYINSIFVKYLIVRSEK
ncbi:CBO0543 family protein [Bacillus sp. JJ1521]|uniref:CBO0543 family protein n=1 Tax=Bacillus sp. JJ1521 TaxID=3122957 RepID=UPI003F68B781